MLTKYSSTTPYKSSSVATIYIVPSTNSISYARISFGRGELAGSTYTCQVRNGFAGQFVGLVCDMRTVPAIKRKNEHHKKRPTSLGLGGREPREELSCSWSCASSLSLLYSACCCLRTNWAFKCNVITFLTPSSVGTSVNRRPLMRCPLCKLAYKLSRVNIKSNDKRVCQNVREAQKEPLPLLQLLQSGRKRRPQHQDMMWSKIPCTPPPPLERLRRSLA